MKNFRVNLLLLFTIGSIGSIVAFLPNFKNPSVSVLIVVWFSSFMVAGGRFLNDHQTSPLATFVMLFNLTNLFLISAIHCLGAFFLVGFGLFHCYVLI